MKFGNYRSFSTRFPQLRSAAGVEARESERQSTEGTQTADTQTGFTSPLGAEDGSDKGEECVPVSERLGDAGARTGLTMAEVREGRATDEHLRIGDTEGH